jgi:predicted CXXCH cytochrome family protein
MVRIGALWALGALALGGCGGEPGPEAGAAGAEAPAPAYVGGQRCVGCHAEEAALWQGSQHDLAMQEANASTVLGNFDDAEFQYGDVTTRFFRRDGRFFVHTDGPDGVPADFEVMRTFGVSPLQQYLIELGDGKIQALGIAWDTRPVSEGGQRWFHLYPNDSIDFRDPLHWTSTYQRWNTMCADCHSTNVVKGYDVAADRFATTFSSIDVDCEACHGPGSLHVADPSTPTPASRAEARSWVFAEGQRIASRVPSGPAGGEVEVCAQCHSRRAQLTDARNPGDPLLDGYRPASLDEGLYHADGQIEGEVYVYGSFLQSAMARAGVTCSDCHEPHSAKLRAEGNALCTRCHLAGAYDRPEHHRHETGSEAAQCTACHMRTEIYMVVDPRRDHSFRVPRPDLSASLDSPNACTDCHSDQSSDWAAARIAEWYPNGRWQRAHFGQALQAGRTWAADAHVRLVELIEDADQPEIARATAVSELSRRLSPADVDVLRRSLDEDSSLLELAAIDASAGLAPELRADLVQRFLTDDRLALRIAAGRALLTARTELSPRRQSDLDAAIAEYLDVQAFNSDRPEGLLNAASVAVDRGRFDEAERLYRLAIERYPSFAALYVNLADLYRVSGRGTEAEQTLRAGLDANPEDAGVRLSLAFTLVREGRSEEALPYFMSAADLAPDDPYYGYVLAIATNDAGETDRALELLRSNHERFPGHPDTLFALATMLRDRGEIDAAYGFAEELNRVMPGDPNALSLLRELEQRL